MEPRVSTKLFWTMCAAKAFFLCKNMNIDFYNSIYNRAAQIIEESKPEPKAKAVDLSSLIERPSFLNEAFPLMKSTDYLKAALGWVYACASAIADEVATIEIKLFKQVKDGVEEVKEHEILDLLFKANNFTTKFDLFWSTQQYLELTGEAPWYLAKSGNTITDILLIRPDLLSILPGTGNNYIDGYKYKINGGNTVNLAPEEVLFLKYPDTTHAFRGKGTLQAAAKTVDIDNFSEDFNRNFFFNSALPGSVLKTEQKLRPEVAKQLKADLNKLYKGVDKAHKAMVLEQGLDWKPMQLSQRDMDFLEQQRFSRDKILGIFRVPKTALGIN